MPDLTLAARVKAKYPGVYDDLSDADLETKVKAKYPGAYDDLPTTTAKAPAPTRDPIEALMGPPPAPETPAEPGFLSRAGASAKTAFNSMADLASEATGIPRGGFVPTETPHPLRAAGKVLSGFADVASEATGIPRGGFVPTEAPHPLKAAARLAFADPETIVEDYRARRYRALLGDLAVPAVLALAPKARETLGRVRATRAVKATAAANDVYFTNMRQALGPITEHPAKDVQVLTQIRPYLSAEHQQTPIMDTPRTFEAVENGVKLTNDVFEAHVNAFAPDVLPIQPLRDAQLALASMRGTRATDVPKGLRDLESFGFDNKPVTVRRAADVLYRLNAEQEKILRENKYERANVEAQDPRFVARQAAADTLRDALYDYFAQQGSPGIRQLRRDQGALIETRQALQRVLQKGGQFMTPKSGNALPARIASKGLRYGTGAATAATGYAMGGPLGGIFGVAVGGPVGEVLANKLVPRLTRDDLFRRAFEKLPAQQPTYPTVPPAGQRPTPPSAPRPVPSHPVPPPAAPSGTAVVTPPLARTMNEALGRLEAQGVPGVSDVRQRFEAAREQLRQAGAAARPTAEPPQPTAAPLSEMSSAATPAPPKRATPRKARAKKKAQGPIGAGPERMPPSPQTLAREAFLRQRQAAEEAARAERSAPSVSTAGPVEESGAPQHPPSDALPRAQSERGDVAGTGEGGIADLPPSLQAHFERLWPHALREGFTEGKRALAEHYLAAVKEAKDALEGQAVSKDDLSAGDDLLAAIAKLGGIGVDANPAMRGEVGSMLEALHGGRAVIKQRTTGYKKGESYIVKVPRTSAGIPGAPGVLKGESMGGHSLDGILKDLRQDPRWEHLPDLAEFTQKVQNAIFDHVQGIGPKAADVSPKAIIDTLESSLLNVRGDRAWWTPQGDTSFDVGEFETPTSDVLPTGETQPRLPGDVGAVRDTEVAHPQFERARADPNDFSLSPEAVEHTQPTLAEEAPEPPTASVETWTPTTIAEAYVKANPSEGAWDASAVSNYGQQLGRIYATLKRHGWTTPQGFRKVAPRYGQPAPAFQKLVDLGAVARAFDRNGDAYYAASGTPVRDGLRINPPDDWFNK